MLLFLRFEVLTVVKLPDLDCESVLSLCLVQPGHMGIDAGRWRQFSSKVLFKKLFLSF
jgi:hypothetical protein